jgi:hypothetical protein
MTDDAIVRNYSVHAPPGHRAAIFCLGGPGDTVVGREATAPADEVAALEGTGAVVKTV